MLNEIIYILLNFIHGFIFYLRVPFSNMSSLNKLLTISRDYDTLRYIDRKIIKEN